MPARTLLAAVALLAACLTMALARDLTIVTRDDSPQDAIRSDARRPVHRRHRHSGAAWTSGPAGWTPCAPS